MTKVKKRFLIRAAPFGVGEVLLADVASFELGIQDGFARPAPIALGAGRRVDQDGRFTLRLVLRGAGGQVGLDVVLVDVLTNFFLLRERRFTLGNIRLA
jgi:hypothetical protein